MSKLTVDGREYDVDVRSITRKFQVLDGTEATRSLSGNMIRDIIGTFYNYSMEIETERLNRVEYDDLYERLSAPVDSHRVTVPYGQGTIEDDFYITAGEDVVKSEDAGGRTWSGLSIEFVVMTPLRRP